MKVLWLMTRWAFVLIPGIDAFIANRRIAELRAAAEARMRENCTHGYVNVSLNDMRALLNDTAVRKESIERRATVLVAAAALGFTAMLAVSKFLADPTSGAASASRPTSCGQATAFVVRLLFSLGFLHLVAAAILGYRSLLIREWYVPTLQLWDDVPENREDDRAESVGWMVDLNQRTLIMVANLVDSATRAVITGICAAALGALTMTWLA